MTHELRTWPGYYHAVADGRKTFEIQRADREFAVGDVLLLREYDPRTAAYTGRRLERKVTYILDAREFLQPGYCCMAICPISGEQTEKMLADFLEPGEPEGWR